MKLSTMLAKSQIKIKIKPKLLISGLIIVLIYFASGFFTSRISFFATTSTLETKEISLSKNTTAKCANQLMWWKFKDNGLNLNYDSLIINSKNLQVYGKKTDTSVAQINLSDSSKIGTGFTGSFMTLPSSVSLDINGDGIEEAVNISAKADTIDTRGFAKVNTYIQDSRFPFEVVIDGNYDLKVYFKNELLKNAELEVTSEDGLNQKLVTDSETGTIHISNMNELRNNINILYSEGNQYYLLSYAVEGHRLLSAEHFKALMNLGTIILISSIIIICIISIKKLKTRMLYKGGI